MKLLRQDLEEIRRDLEAKNERLQKENKRLRKENKKLRDEQVCHADQCKLEGISRLRGNIKAIEKNTDYWADEARRLREYKEDIQAELRQLANGIGFYHETLSDPFKALPTYKGEPLNNALMIIARHGSLTKWKEGGGS